jgi:hypothetical protein
MVSFPGINSFFESGRFNRINVRATTPTPRQNKEKSAGFGDFGVAKSY